MNVQKYWSQLLAALGDATGAKNIDQFQKKHLAIVVSGGKSSLTATTALTAATAAGKKFYLDSTSALTVTLPAAIGSGSLYRFRVVTTNTNSYIIKVANTTDVMRGFVSTLDNDAAAVTGYAATGTDDTLTLNGTTTGGIVGDWVDFEDLASGVWHVRGAVVIPAGSNPVDVFSATV